MDSTEEYLACLNVRIPEAIDESALDLGITFKDGHFYPAGARELDQALIIETLDWLKEFRLAQKTYKEALRDYLRKDYSEAVTKCYSALESLSKEHLNTDRGLDSLSPELLSSLSLSSQWKGVLAHFCIYAHEFGSRHGKREQKHKNPSVLEVEAYIYQTGLLMRLICRAREATGAPMK